MSMIKSGMGTAIALAALIGLSGCRVAEEAPEEEATPTDSPRSIFQDDPAQDGSSGLPPPVLPPLETTLSFADGTAELIEAVRAELATIIASPQVRAGGRIVVRGHTDSQGSDEESLAVSRERAEAVRDFFEENGIEPERIELIAFGEQNPVEPNALPDGSPNEAGRAANRRVEVTVRTGAEAEREQTLIETLSEGEEAQEETARPGAPSRQ